MMADVQQLPSAEQIGQFIQYLNEIAERIKSPAPDSLLQLKNRGHALHTEDGPHQIAAPRTLHRMSSILYRNTNLTMGELSSALSVPVSTATRMVTLLVDHGYAQRSSDPHDRRIVRVALTDTGRCLYEAIETYIEESVRRILECLTAEERLILLTLLGKVASALKKEA